MDKELSAKKQRLQKMPLSNRIDELNAAISQLAHGMLRIQSDLRRYGWQLAKKYSVEAREQKDRMTGMLTDVREGFTQLDRLDFFRFVGIQPVAEAIGFSNATTHKSYMKFDNQKLQEGVEKLLQDHAWWAAPGGTIVVSGVQPRDWTHKAEGLLHGKELMIEAVGGESMKTAPKVMVAVNEGGGQSAIVFRAESEAPLYSSCPFDQLVNGDIYEEERPHLEMQSDLYLAKHDENTGELEIVARAITAKVTEDFRELPNGFYGFNLKVDAVGRIDAIGQGPYLVIRHNLTSSDGTLDNDYFEALFQETPTAKKIIERLKRHIDSPNAGKKPFPEAIAIGEHQFVLALAVDGLQCFIHNLSRNDGTQDDERAKAILNSGPRFAICPGAYFWRIDPRQFGNSE